MRSPWKNDSTRSLLHTPAGSWVVTSAAIMVPTTAVPRLVPTSWAVSLRAAPMEVRLLGIASMRATAQMVMTVRSPIVISTMQTAMAAYPWSTAQARPANEPARKPAPTRQAMRWPNHFASHSENGVAAIIVTIIGRFARPAFTGLQPYANWKWRISPNITLAIAMDVPI